MSRLFVFLFMIFMHILDDFKVQAGVLAFLKQKAYWQKNAPDKMYKYDYIMGLIMHGLSWSFMVMLPVAIFYKLDVGRMFYCVFFVNAMIHSVIDDLKANRGMINLCQDQIIHLLQITCIWIIFLAQ